MTEPHLVIIISVQSLSSIHEDAVIHGLCSLGLGIVVSYEKLFPTLPGNKSTISDSIPPDCLRYEANIFLQYFICMLKHLCLLAIFRVLYHVLFEFWPISSISLSTNLMYAALVLRMNTCANLKCSKHWRLSL